MSGETDRMEEEFNIHPNKLKFLQFGKACVKIETGGAEKPFLNIIDLKDMQPIPKQPVVYKPDKKQTDNRTTNIDLKENKGENIIGKSESPTLKWKHIRANAKKEQEEEQNEED